jgi:choline-sulfatase
MLADKHIGTVLDTLEETRLMDDSIVLRFSDHGEGDLPHGMREKAYTVYEEMVHIPLIVHSRRLFPEPSETDAFYNHLDLLRTILELAGIRNANSYAIGNSSAPVIVDPSRHTQDHLLFSFDDDFFLPYGFPGGHIRALIDGDWTYAAYFGLDGGRLEYELHDRKTDRGQMKNLLFAPPSADVKKEWSRLQEKMTQRFIEAANLPNTIAWRLSAG